jgi:hypothetical protein
LTRPENKADYGLVVGNEHLSFTERLRASSTSTFRGGACRMETHGMVSVMAEMK